MTHFNTTDKNRTLGRKLHPRYTAVAFSFYMASIMALLMCALITAVNRGVDDAFLSWVWKAYQVAMPCAFICVLMVRPLVLKLVRWTVQPH
ncbi:DUF2798 domain-containing protein [Gilvimarinus agarilyticus]|uniref:DUF2798 domain-containing protein n=1 Tax=Gilvimarinus agarilyticus TaxID=679259 RepID=UPI0005A11C1D|nr:DUF2798 domain-containing protein [Gilvimarinus agarilyticus]